MALRRQSLAGDGNRSIGLSQLARVALLQCQCCQKEESSNQERIRHHACLFGGARCCSNPSPGPDHPTGGRRGPLQNGTTGMAPHSLAATALDCLEKAEPQRHRYVAHHTASSQTPPATPRNGAEEARRLENKLNGQVNIQAITLTLARVQRLLNGSLTPDLSLLPSLMCLMIRHLHWAGLQACQQKTIDG